MIDFRYHLVSIIAVFLALAVGIVVGTTALNGPIADNLQGSISSLSANKRQLQGEVSDLRGTIGRDNDFTTLIAGTVLKGELTGQRVLVVSTPEADQGVRDAVLRDLTTAGATVVGQVRLRPDLFDPAKSATVDGVVAQVLPSDVTIPSGSSSERAAATLATALVRRTGSTVTAAQSQQVIGGFQGAHLLDIDSDAVLPTATLVLMLAGPAPSGKPADLKARNAAELALARAFDARAGMVLAGPVTALDPGGLLGALRDDGALTRSVSTVDSVDTPRGQVAVVLALHQQTQDGVGSYGDGRGAQGPAPSPLP